MYPGREARNAYRILVGKPLGKLSLRRPKKLGYNAKIKSGKVRGEVRSPVAGFAVIRYKIKADLLSIYSNEKLKKIMKHVS
jgi:hypothetical protein